MYAASAPAQQVTDDRGRTLDAGAAARRVVALAPHLAELLHEIGAGTDLVGVVRGADFPEAVKQVAQVGDASGIDLERVLALRPDLVLAWESGNRASDLARLEALGLRLFVSEPRDLSAVPSTLRRLGRLSGREQAGEQAAAAFEARLHVLRARAAAPVPTFVQIWDKPLMTISGEHLISQVLRHCGGDNVFAALPAPAASVALESVLVRDPAVILVLAPPGRAGEWTAAWSRLERLRAVHAHQVTALDPDLLTRATSRLLRGVEAVCRVLAAGQ